MMLLAIVGVELATVATVGGVRVVVFPEFDAIKVGTPVAVVSFEADGEGATDETVAFPAGDGATDVLLPVKSLAEGAIVELAAEGATLLEFPEDTGGKVPLPPTTTDGMVDDKIGAGVGPTDLGAVSKSSLVQVRSPKTTSP